jgi:hypothetical protein
MQMAPTETDIRMTRAAGAGLPVPRTPERRVVGDPQRRLNVSVLFTSVEGTMAALRTAGTLASRLGGHITLVVPEVVPFHLPLDKPAVLHDWNERRFRVLAAESPVDTTVRFYLCRDRDEMLAKALEPHSLVVIAGKKRWWPTSESRMAKRLRGLGHEVILTEME